MNVTDVRQLADRIAQNVSKVIVGKEDVLRLVIASMLARGHVLLEDVPGTGKTVMAKTLARSVDLTFKRIQFTPDLLPSDITGMSIFDQKENAFVFRPGPVFAGILLADEINRATPRSQSALLEAMEERQVTGDGVTYPLDEPFLVLATQNPIEIQGTFPLPEAQLDRFLMKLSMGYPSAADAAAILDRFVRDDPLSEISPVATAAEMIEAQQACRMVEVSEPVRDYIIALVERTRQLEQVMLGASPRASLALMRAAQAFAAVQGREFVTPDDVKELASPVLAHRLTVRGAYGRTGQGEAAIADALRMSHTPTEKRPAYYE